MQIVELTDSAEKSDSMLTGIIITAGGAVGAGMFALPTVSSGMWFGWSVACMLLSWFCMYHTSLMILEVNLNFREGESFDTLVKSTLGKGWNVINGLLLVFILYILDYAYISGGGSIVNQTLFSAIGVAPPQMISGVFFALSLAVVVWVSTKAVARVTIILTVGMAVTFLLAIVDLKPFVDLSRLLNKSNVESQSHYIYFIFAALPFYLTSFGFYTNVPSLVKFYGKKPVLIRRSMLIGSTLCIAIYLLWLIVSMGSLQREAFLPVVAEGGNVGVLLSTISQLAASEGLVRFLNMFANMAIVSSFLGVSLGLFDFIADKFKFDDTAKGRFKTSLVAFIPPSVGGLFFPDGFIYAIGFAGLALAVNALIIPPLMLRASRKKYGSDIYRLWGGNILIYFMMSMGLFYAVCHILAMLNVLPVYGK
jgi:tryptophan-specific transport protein